MRQEVGGGQRRVGLRGDSLGDIQRGSDPLLPHLRRRGAEGRRIQQGDQAREAEGLPRVDLRINEPVLGARLAEEGFFPSSAGKDDGGICGPGLRYKRCGNDIPVVDF